MDVFFVYAIEYIIRGEEPDGRDRRETVRWTVEQGAFEAGLNEAGERDPTRAFRRSGGEPLMVHHTGHIRTIISTVVDTPQ